MKVSSHILFPETLDLSQYGCQANRETFKFHLTGVIIHRGPTAYSGHYIAHILDKMVQTEVHHLIWSTAINRIVCAFCRLVSGIDLMMNVLAS